MKRGRFITFEGGEGSGKSTQAQQLAERLETTGIDTYLTREPGGTPGAEAIRELLLNRSETKWDGMSELLLFSAARHDHLQKVILPKLQQGIWVICDRFADSTLAYQGYGNGLAREFITRLYRMVVGDFHPDLTLILDLDVTVGLSRAKQVTGEQFDHFEAQDIAFHQRLRDGFRDIAKKERQRCQLINAEASPEEVSEAIAQIVQEKLGVTSLLEHAS